MSCLPGRARAVSASATGSHQTYSCVYEISCCQFLLSRFNLVQYLARYTMYLCICDGIGSKQFNAYSQTLAAAA